MGALHACLLGVGDRSELLRTPLPTRQEAKRYVDLVTPVAASLLSANPKIKDDYEALLAAAKKYRQ